MNSTQELRYGDVCHAAASYGIGSVHSFTEQGGTALFCGTYRSNLMKGQEWIFVAKRGRHGGICIKRVSQQREVTQ